MWTSYVADLLFPLRCLGCKAYDYWLCPSCLHKLTPVNGALGLYQDSVLQRAIHCMKYQGYRGIAAELGQYLAQQVPPITYDVVIPVPLHWQRRWERGYNQAEVIARQFPKPVLPALRKVRRTKVQASLNRLERQHNLVGVFQVKPRWLPRLQGQRVLLIDDVYSTGATTTACNKVLLEVGVQSVQVVVLALNPSSTNR